MDSYSEELKLTKDHIENLENQIIELETKLHELSKELQIEGRRFNLLSNITQDIEKLSEIDNEYEKRKCKECVK